MKNFKGFEAALDALRQLDSKSQERILSDILKKDPKMAERLRKNLIVFDDLIKINPQGKLKLLQEIPEPILVMALKGKPQDFIQKMLQPLVKRKLDSVLEAMAELGPQPISKVEEARKELLKKALELEKKGQLIFSKGDDPLV